MLSEEVKLIMEEKFDKGKNYKKIIQNVKKSKNRRKSYLKAMQYALLPSCAVIVLGIVAIPTMKNNNNKFKNELAIAEANNENLTNGNDEIYTNTEINSSNNVIVEEDKNIIEEVPTSITVAKEVYKKIECGEASWAVNPSIPSNLINKTSSVVRVKILSVNDAEMIPEQQNFKDPYRAYTPVEMQILDNLYGKNLSGKIKAYLTGGKIQIAKLQNSASEEQLKNLGINNLSSEDKLKYIDYETSYDYDLTIGNEYIIIIKQVNNNLYKISENGYDIFDAETYKNVLTNQKLEIQK